MDTMALTLLLAVVGVALFVWWLAMLIDALRIPSAVWARAGQNQLLFVLLMVFLGVVGTAVYLVAARPALRREARTVPSW